MLPESWITRISLNGQHPPRSGGLRVLVVDDDADTIRTTDLLLKLWGHQTLAVSTGAEALDHTPSFQPDVALLDLALPKLDGLRLAERLSQLNPGRALTLIALTGFTGTEFRRRCQRAGFFLLLRKPVPPVLLEAILSQLAACKTESLPVEPKPEAKRATSRRDEIVCDLPALDDFARRVGMDPHVLHVITLARQTMVRAEESLQVSLHLLRQTTVACARTAELIIASRVVRATYSCFESPLAASTLLPCPVV
jgi:CheY-like chemotaxis protein